MEFLVIDPTPSCLYNDVVTWFFLNVMSLNDVQDCVYVRESNLKGAIDQLNALDMRVCYFYDPNPNVFVLTNSMEIVLFFSFLKVDINWTRCFEMCNL